MCSYPECDGGPRDFVTPYPDISGIGVVIGYVGLSVITVVIVVLHYLIAFDPRQDPFSRVRGQDSPPFQPNHVDLIVVEEFKAWLGRQMRRIPGLNCLSILRSSVPIRFHHDPSTSCVKLMGDIQILNGISILASGFAQLRCGLSFYHWQVMVYLAWFSSLTHLACLSFLRGYLCSRPGERAWRAAAMCLFVLMLIVAIVPTGHSAPAGDFALCYFSRSSEVSLQLSNMVLSEVILISAFVTRVAKLSFRFSAHRPGQFKSATSNFISWLHAKAYKPEEVFRMVPYIFYLLQCMALAGYIFIEVWTSATMEIVWLLLSFYWGSLRLFRAWRSEDGGNSTWSFGQIAPVILLSAPLISTLEQLFAGDQCRPSINTNANRVWPGHRQPECQRAWGIFSGMRTARSYVPTRDGPTHPGHAYGSLMTTTLSEGINLTTLHDDLTPQSQLSFIEFYQRSWCYRAFVAFVMLGTVWSVGYIGINPVPVRTLIPSVNFWDWIPSTTFITWTLFIVASFDLDWITRHRHISGSTASPSERPGGIGNFFLCLGAFLLLQVVFIGLQTTSSMLYPLVAVMHAFSLALHRRARKRGGNNPL